MKRAEIIFLILALVAIALNLFLIPGATLLTILAFSALAMIYYFGFLLFNDIKLRKIFKKESYQGLSGVRALLAGLAGIALSITTMGLLFKIQMYPGANIMLYVGLAGLVIVAIIGAVTYTKSASKFYTKIFSRIALFGGVALLSIFGPSNLWIEFKYRDHPAYLDALKQSLADPQRS